MRYILGKKIGMVQVFDVNGKVIPVTVIHCEPNKVIETKTKEKNGYVATKVAYDLVDAKKVDKATKGTFKKAKSEPRRIIKELRNLDGYQIGDTIKVTEFKSGEFVDVQGTSKGHGFTGAIKRWNFKIGPLGHGAGYPHRYQGSIAMGRGGSQAQRVKKGQKMSGHYGNEKITIQNLEVIAVKEREDLILVKGAIPGARDGVVIIKEAIKKPKAVTPAELVTIANIDEILKQNEALTNKDTLHEINEAAEHEAAELEKQEQLAKEKEEKAKEEEEKRLEQLAKQHEEQEAKKKAEAEAAAEAKRIEEAKEVAAEVQEQITEIAVEQEEKKEEGK